MAKSHDVQSLLAQLASYSSDPQTNETTSQSTVSTNHTAFSSNLPGLGNLAPEAYQAALSKPSTPSPASYQPPDKTLQLSKQPSALGDRSHPATKVNLASSVSNGSTNSSATEPSTITDWPTAIKHVMQHLLPSPDFGTRIRHLITTQHQYEEDWATKRTLITTRHASRDNSSAQLSNIFASLGVPMPASNTAATADTTTAILRDREAEQRELAEYDAKVYKQLLALVGDFDRQLRQLGVPFYAIRHDLVILEEGREKEVYVGNVKVKRVDRGELRELQKRMLEWLEMSFPV